MGNNNTFKHILDHRQIIKPSGAYHRILIFTFILLMLSLSGCVSLADPEASQVYTSDSIGNLDYQTQIGQSFISRRSNLNSVTIWLTPLSNLGQDSSTNTTNTINVKLYFSPRQTTLLFATTVIIPTNGNNLPVTINLPQQKNSAEQYYYLLFSKEQGSVSINGRKEDAYPFGQAYINTKPVNSDIAFRLNYAYDFSTFSQDIKVLPSQLWLIFPLLGILWLPGWFILDFSGLRHCFDLGEQIAMSIGLSLAIIPLLMLWTSRLKIKWTSTAVLIIIGILFAIGVTRLIYFAFKYRKSQSKSRENQSFGQQTIFSKNVISIQNNTLTLILIFLAALAIRLIMVRDLATPAWVDSVHHALITRLIMESGGFPSTYLPYLDIPTAAYHPGFHSIAAAFTWLSKLDLIKSLLVLGQVLNALTVISVYLFTKTFTRSTSAGLFAALITGFITPMPTYYTSWGRYTELTALLVLPVIPALINLWPNRERKSRDFSITLLGAIAAGGLFMIHYRVVIFLSALIFAYLIILFLSWKDSTERKTRKLSLNIFIMASLAIIFVSPWFIQTLKTTVIPIVKSTATESVPFFQDFTWPYLTSALGMQSLALAGLGFLWGVIKRRKFTIIILFWVIIMFFLANLITLRLPGGGLISNSSVEIMLFIPISVFGGYLVSKLLAYWKNILPNRLLLPSTLVFLLIVGYTTFLGARQLIPIINPSTILSRQADLSAIQWLNDHISGDETVVINPFAWGYGLYAGSDGGYWISPLSGKLTIPPPVLYGLGNDANQINQLSQDIISFSSDPISLRKFMITNQYQYIFTGAKGGVIPPEKLISSGLFIMIYHQDGVWILGVKP